jgi:hypothetical protein
LERHLVLLVHSDYSSIQTIENNSSSALHSDTAANIEPGFFELARGLAVQAVRGSDEVDAAVIFATKQTQRLQQERTCARKKHTAWRRNLQAVCAELENRTESNLSEQERYGVA